MRNIRAQSSEVPNHGGTIFISYARADDEPFPLDPSAPGWVTFFREMLRYGLADAGLHQVEPWLDRYQIEPAESFTENIEAALKKARLIMPILSPNWVQRPWCRRELERFCELQAHDPGANDNIALVYKKLPPPTDVPQPLQNREGYRFFARHPISGTVRDYYYWGGLKDREAYCYELKRLVDWIYKKLTTHAPQPAVPLVPSNGRALFVAVAADELRDARQRLVNDLTGAGFTVLPADDRLPDTAVAAEAAVREALAAAELAVHLLGEANGFTPGGGQEPILSLQLRLARERAAQGGLRQILWAPKWLPGRPHTRRDPFAVVAQYGERRAGEEVYAEEITDLSQWLRSRLYQPEAKPPERGPRHMLVAGASAADDDLVSTLAGRLQGKDLQVQALFAGDLLPVIESAAAFSVLVPWGEAARADLDALFATLTPLAPITVLRLPGGDETAKKRFFAQNVYMENLKELPANRKAARELLVHLAILEPTP